TGRVSVLAVVAAPGCALRDNDSANRINQLPDYEFAQLDAHNLLFLLFTVSCSGGNTIASRISGLHASTTKVV
ncbi:MAG: hypothetical protein AB1593_11655, partial [Pseudomonadota bacterium]